MGNVSFYFFIYSQTNETEYVLTHNFKSSLKPISNRKILYFCCGDRVHVFFIIKRDVSILRYILQFCRSLEEGNEHGRGESVINLHTDLCPLFLDKLQKSPLFFI